MGGRGKSEKAGGECGSRRREFRGRASPGQLAARPARGHAHLSVGGASPEEMPASGRSGLEDLAPRTNPGGLLTPRTPASVVLLCDLSHIFTSNLSVPSARLSTLKIGERYVVPTCHRNKLGVEIKTLPA